jgi:hypothetical protein
MSKKRKKPNGDDEAERLLAEAFDGSEAQFALWEKNKQAKYLEVFAWGVGAYARKVGWDLDAHAAARAAAMSCLLRSVGYFPAEVSSVIRGLEKDGYFEGIEQAWRDGWEIEGVIGGVSDRRGNRPWQPLPAPPVHAGASPRAPARSGSGLRPPGCTGLHARRAFQASYAGSIPATRSTRDRGSR